MMYSFVQYSGSPCLNNLIPCVKYPKYLKVNFICSSNNQNIMNFILKKIPYMNTIKHGCVIRKIHLIK